LLLDFILAIRSSLLISCLLIFGVSLGGAQQNPSANSSEKVDKKVVQRELLRVIDQAAKEATVKTADGVIVTTTPLVSSEGIDKVKSFGDDAAVFLGNYVKESKNPVEQQVAMRLLGSMSSDRSLDELGELAEKAQSSFIRSLALGWIASTRRDKDALLLQRISASDPDPQVRAEATRLLQRKSKK